jgi:hypothetical protein
MSMFFAGGELAQSRLGLPRPLTGVFQGLLLFAPAGLRHPAACFSLSLDIPKDGQPVDFQPIPSLMDTYAFFLLSAALERRYCCSALAFPWAS